jgi:hypothetical protein
MKTFKLYFSFIILIFNTLCLYSADTKDTVSSNKIFWSLEGGIRNITNWKDKNGWIGESNNLYSILSVSSFIPKFKIISGVDFYSFTTFKLKGVWNEEFKTDEVFRLHEYREYSNIRFFCGRYLESKRLLFSYFLSANYLFNGFEGRYLGGFKHYQGHILPIFGHSTMKGFGIGGGIDLKYKIKERYTVALNMNYTSYNLKRTFEVHQYHNRYPGLPTYYDENTPGVDIYNSLYSIHLKIGYLLGR